MSNILSFTLIIIAIIIFILIISKKSKKNENLGYIPKDKIKNKYEINSDIFVPDNEFSEYFFENTDFNQPFFQFSGLDHLGRAGISNAVIDKVMINSLKRDKDKNINYKPSGFYQKKYKEIEDGFLYNRCHLLGYQLIYNDDKRNLMTGTRDFNVKGMLPIENAICEFITNEEGIVKYEVIPDFHKDELLARGAYIKAIGVSGGEVRLKINGYVKNIQAGIKIDYNTGFSRKE